MRSWSCDWENKTTGANKAFQATLDSAPERNVRWLERKLCQDKSAHLYFQLATRNGSCYTIRVIKKFKHEGLKNFFSGGSKAGIQTTHARRLRLILGRLHASTNPQDMNLPGLYLHELTGNRKGAWSVRVSGNLRVTFRFVGQDAVSVDYEDYH